jgi:hypothetical protein
MKISFFHLLLHFLQYSGYQGIGSGRWMVDDLQYPDKKKNDHFFPRQPSVL